MPDMLVVLAGNLAVVWYDAYDTPPEAPRRVYDLYTNNGLLHDFAITMNVEGQSMWILDDRGEDQRVFLTRYRQDGGTYLYDVPDSLDEALRPASSVPPTVWARAVAEAHERTCQGRVGGCYCTELRHELTKSGLLL